MEVYPWLISPRFSLDTLAVVGGGFLAVSAMSSFAASTAAWLGFGVSTLFAVAAAAAAVFTRSNSARFGHGTCSPWSRCGR